jgi:hypothetical protein
MTDLIFPEDPIVGQWFTATNDAVYEWNGVTWIVIGSGNQGNYYLPTASTSVLGGVKIDGSTITINNGVISSTSSATTSQLVNGSYTLTLNSDGTLKVPGTIWAQASDNGSIVFSDDGSTDHGSLKVDGGHNMVISAESNFYIKRAGQDRLGITDTNTTLMAGTDLVLKSNKNATEKVLTLGADGNLTLPRGLTFSAGAQIFEQSDNIGAAWATGLNIRGTNDPIRIYPYGADSKGYNAAGITVNQHSVVIYGNSLQPSSPGTAWTFGSNGNLTIPNGGKIQTTAGSGTSSIQILANGPGEINLTAADDSGGSQSTWSFFSVGQLELPEGGTITYTPATASDWAGTPPITIQEAIDRLAAAVKALNGSGA